MAAESIGKSVGGSSKKMKWWIQEEGKIQTGPYVSYSQHLRRAKETASQTEVVKLAFLLSGSEEYADSEGELVARPSSAEEKKSRTRILPFVL